MTSKELLLLAQANAWAADGTARRLRVSSGLTLDLVGQFCGVTGACISHWEKCTRRPRGRPGLRWAKLLHDLDAQQSKAAAS